MPDTTGQNLLGQAWDAVKGWILPTGVIGGILTYAFNKKTGTDLESTDSNWLMSMLPGGIAKPIQAFFDWIGDLFTSAKKKFTDWLDPEAGTAEKGMEIRINQTNIFPVMESALGIPGIGGKLKEKVSEAIKEGGDPVDNARKLYDTINTFVLEELKSKPGWTSLEAIKERANATAAAITGLPADEAARNDQNPDGWNAGYVGMLKQAKTAKDAPTTLSESDIAAIKVTPAMNAAKEAARTGVQL